MSNLNLNTVNFTNHTAALNGVNNNNNVTQNQGTATSAAASSSLFQSNQLYAASQGINFNNVNTNNIILQTLKRRVNKVVVPLDERVTLEKAYGFTITSNTRLSQSPDGTIAYLAGCVIVLYDPTRQSQEFIISQARKTLTTVAFSHDGRCLATGESGHDPKVRVWDVRERVQMCEFGGHKFSIECVCFSTSPHSHLLVSIGSMHDMVVNVWNLKTRFKVASNKIACKVKGVAFSRDGAYFVTVGNRHVKFWYLTISSLMETVPLKGRAAILGELKNNYFCDVVCGSDECSHYTYTITTNGMLCEFNENRCLSRAIDLRTERAYCIYADANNLFIGCSNGTIDIFRQKNLEFLAILPRPHNLGVDVAKGLDTRHVLENLNNRDLKYPDCVALCYDSYSYILSAIYNDHSFYVWDIRDLGKVKKIDSHLFHSSCCWALDIYSPSSTSTNSNNLPLDSFVTCSTDNTLRIWSSVSNNRADSSWNGAKLKRNIYSRELLKIIYVDNDLSALCDVDQSVGQSSETSDSASNVGGGNGGAQTSSNLTSSSSSSSSSASSSSGSGGPVTNLPSSAIIMPDSGTNNNSTAKMGARCLKINPFGTHLATGDRNGNIRIYDLNTLESVCMIEAHDGEILYLQYSQPESGRLLLASSSRDRLIHIFDASRNSYDLLQTLDDHSAAITAVRFCFNSIEKQLYVISCGADKSIMFRTTGDQQTQSGNAGLSVANGSSTSSSCSPSPNGSSSSSTSGSGAAGINQSQLQFVRTSYVAEKQTFYDLNIDATKNHINTISQDRMVRTYSIKDGKRLRQFRGSLNEDGYLLKMDTDRNGNLMATSCTDKCVYVWDLNTCECVAYIYGHSEVVTDLKFTSDNQHLITVSGDGCIFIWKLNNLTNITNNNPLNSTINTSANNSTINNLHTPVPSAAPPSTFNYRRTISLNQNLQQQAQSQPQPQPVPTVQPILQPTQLKHQHSLDTIFDNDQDTLPAWVRNKLNNLGVGSSVPNILARSTTNDDSTTTKPAAFHTEQVKEPAAPTLNQSNQTRRSRAVWGPVLNTSFAVMLENDSSTSSLPSANNSSISLNQHDQCESPTVTTPSTSAGDSTLTNIQFPSPCVDKDFFHIKQVKLIETGANRLSWAEKISPKADVSPVPDELSSAESNPAPAAAQSTTTNSNNSTIVDSTSPTVNGNSKLKAESPSSGSSSSSSSSPTYEFTSDFSKILNQDFVSPSGHFVSKPTVSNATSETTTNTTTSTISADGNNDMIDTIIKLNSDIENSIRRQSISARYLLKTQLQKQNSTEVSSTPVVASNSTRKSISSSVSSATNELEKDAGHLSDTSNETDTIGTSVEVNVNGGSKSPPPQVAPVPPQQQSQTANPTPAQMAADLLRIRRKSTFLNNFPTALGGTATGAGQHTESSMNKIKQRIGSDSKPVAGLQSYLKRSPSANSLVNDASTSNPSSVRKTESTRPSGVKSHVKQHSSGGGPSKHPTANSQQQQSASEPDDENGSNTNLKKASSMISLLNSNAGSQQLLTKSKNVKSTKPEAQQTQQQQSSHNNLLPPKTLRQIKQRSAERQMTSTGILSTAGSTNPTGTGTNFHRQTSINTFNEQNKHIRKLSNSIQNLHQSQQQTLPPQAPPRGAPNVPQFQLSPTKSINKPIVPLPTGHHQPTPKSKFIGKQTQPKQPPAQPTVVQSQQQQQQQQQQQITELVLLDTNSNSDQMSSSSSQNGDFNDAPATIRVAPVSSSVGVKSGSTPAKTERNFSNDATDNNNIQSVQYQTSSISLTSSSSSSCSIFENMNAQSMLPGNVNGNMVEDEEEKHYDVEEEEDDDDVVDDDVDAVDADEELDAEDELLIDNDDVDFDHHHNHNHNHHHHHHHHHNEIKLNSFKLKPDRKVDHNTGATASGSNGTATASSASSSTAGGVTGPSATSANGSNGSTATGGLTSPTSQPTAASANGGSSFLGSSNVSGLKKPITFAALAAANMSNQINVVAQINSGSPTNNSNNNVTPMTAPSGNSAASSNPTSKHLNNEKINEFIMNELNEFKQNMYILDMIFKQTSSNVEDYLKFQQTSASLINQTNPLSLSSLQTIHLIHAINTNMNSLLKQYKSTLTQQQQQQQQNYSTSGATSVNTSPTNTVMSSSSSSSTTATVNSTNSDKIKLDNDLEIA